MRSQNSALTHFHIEYLGKSNNRKILPNEFVYKTLAENSNKFHYLLHLRLKTFPIDKNCARKDIVTLDVSTGERGGLENGDI